MSDDLDAVRQAWETLDRELAGWLAGERRREAVANEIRCREGILGEREWLQGLESPEPWQQERLRLLDYGADYDREQLDKLKTEQRRHEEVTARVQEAEGVIFDFADRHGIDARPLSRLFLGGWEQDQLEEAVFVLRRVEGVLEQLQADGAAVLAQQQADDAAVLAQQQADDAAVLAQQQADDAAAVSDTTRQEPTPARADALPVPPAATGEPGGEGARPPTEEAPVMFLRYLGGIWRLRYPGDPDREFPVKGHKFLGWLAKLLSKPGHPWTVAELLGDPDGKIEADASLGGERVHDREGIRKIWNRIEEIDAITEATGGSAALEAEKDDLLQEVTGHAATKQAEAEVRQAYNNITTQKRLFLKKLAKEMPRLAAHLRTHLRPSGSDYTITYRPAAGTSSWAVEFL
jgi:hypothetical protein